MMKMGLSAAALCLALALSACGETGPARNVTSIRVANPQSEALKALSPPMQRLGLMRAIRDGGRRCQRVEATAYQQHYNGLEMWIALCNDNREWAIFVAPDAAIQVRNCAENAQINLPACRPLAMPAVEGAAGGNAVEGNAVGAATGNAAGSRP